MWPVIIGAALGAYVVGRGKPTTKFRKLQMVGPSTGDTYEAEEMPEAGILVVRGPGPSTAVFLRKQSGGFVLFRGFGHPEGVRRIVSDVCPQMLSEGST